MRTRWQMAWTLALVVATAGPGLAQGRGHGRGRENAPGQLKKEDRGDDGPRFNDHDRVYAHNWYWHSRRSLPPGLRDRDRLPPGIEERFRAGWVVEPEWRARIQPAPVVLVRGFTPAPEGCRYVLLGGHLALIDAGFRVMDVIHLEINLGQ